jgi:hypothetical protein
MAKMHAEEIEFDEAYVRCLICWAVSGLGRLAASPDRTERHRECRLPKANWLDLALSELE